MFRKYLMSKIDSLQREVEFLQQTVKAYDAQNETGKTGPAQPEAEVPAQVVEKKARKTPAPKSEVKTEAKAEEVVQAKDVSDDDFLNDDTTEELSGPTKEDVRKIVKEFASKHGKDKALALLKKFSVTSIPDLKESDYSKLIELAKKHL